MWNKLFLGEIKFFQRRTSPVKSLWWSNCPYAGINKWMEKSNNFLINGTCHRHCRLGGVFVTGGTGGFLLWKSPVRPAARVLRRDDCNFVPMSNFWAFDEIKHTDNLTVIPLYCDITEYYLFVFFIGILRCQIFLLHLVLSFQYTSLCRCDGFVVACSIVGCLCDNPRGTGGYEIITMTTLRRNCCRFGEVFS